VFLPHGKKCVLKTKQKKRCSGAGVFDNAVTSFYALKITSPSFYRNFSCSFMHIIIVQGIYCDIYICA
jgi:hypothetical protein